MVITFTVHGVNKVPSTVWTEVGGESIQATIEALEVELVSDHYGSLRLRFVGSEKTEAETKFVDGSTVLWTV